MNLNVENFKDPKMQLANFVERSYRSTLLLFDNGFHGQSLIVFYSTIDAFGLLVAEIGTVSASQRTFKEWVRNYLVPSGSQDFNEDDMWGARCGVLHTFTSESDLSRSNKVRQIQYVSEGTGTPIFEAMKLAARDVDGGDVHVLVDLKELYVSFGEALARSLDELVVLTDEDSRYSARVSKVLQSISFL